MRVLLCFYFMLGFVFQFPSVAVRFWLIEDVGLTPAQIMAMNGIVGIPWCLKPFYGFLSDSYPICGYRRVPYILIGCWLATLSYWCMPFFTDYVTLFMFTASLGLCVSDVVCDSILVVFAREEKDTGNIQSWVWGLRAVGGLLASLTGGAAYNALGPQLVLALTGAFPLFMSLLFLLIREAPHTPQGARKTVKTLFRAFPWKPALFLFLMSVTPGFGAVTSYYFESVLKFTAWQFSALDTTSYVTSILGTIVYRKYLTKVPFQKIFLYTLALSWCLKWSYISIVTNFNESLGISNMVLAMVDSIILSLLGQCILLPAVVLAAKICPQGVEGSLYATLMSITNLAGVLSSEWGSLFANMYGVDKNNFGNFWKLICLCNMIDLVPIASVVLLKEV